MKKFIYASLLLALAFAFSALAAAQAEPENYRLEIKVPETLSPGAKGEIQIKIIPTNGYKMNEEAPLRIDYKASEEGVKFAKERQIKTDALNPKALEAMEFKNEITGEKTGEYELELSLRFVICTPKDCQPKRTTKKFKLKISA